MNKLFTILIVLLTFGTVMAKSQNELKPNTNIDANELIHYLSSNGDSLVLECSKSIYLVEFIKDDFSQEIKINDTKALIYLNDLPYGQFTVAVTIPNKIIVFTLFRDINPDDIVNNRRDKKDGSGLSDNPNAKLMTAGDNSLSVIKEIATIGVDTEEDEPVEIKKPIYTTANRFFYVKESVNANSGSHTSYRIVNEKAKKYLIEKIE